MNCFIKFATKLTKIYVIFGISLFFFSCDPVLIYTLDKLTDPSPIKLTKNEMAFIDSIKNSHNCIDSLYINTGIDPEEYAIHLQFNSKIDSKSKKVLMNVFFTFYNDKKHRTWPKNLRVFDKKGNFNFRMFISSGKIQIRDYYCPSC